MSSDKHWNQISNILGTPGPTEPPKERPKKEKPKKEAQPAAEDEKTKATDSKSSEEKNLGAKAGDVISALTSKVKMPSLPGFGTRKSDPNLEDLAGKV